MPRGAAATAELGHAVTFYAGITTDEIGGTGVRWQEREAAASLPAGEIPADLAAPQPALSPNGSLLLGAYRSIWASPEVSISPALKFLARTPTIELSPADAERIGIAQGGRVRIAADGLTVAGTAAIRSDVPEGSVFVEDGSRRERSSPGRGRTRRGARSMNGLIATVAYSEPWWVQIIKAVIIFAVGLQLIPLVLLAERKLFGRFQGRYGPNRVGPFGALQPLADIIKLATKEPFRPRTAVGFIFSLRPDHLDPDRGRDPRDRAVRQHPLTSSARRSASTASTRRSGSLYAFAFGGIAFYGLMLGGWASGSKYSFLGAMRAAAQLISYEISQGLALVGVIMTAGTLSLTQIVEQQAVQCWFIVPQFVGFIVFLIAGFAETNSAPFDLAEADAELVGGYMTEYGGGGFVSFFFAEYLNVIIVCAVTATVFLGGWLLPFGMRPARLGRPVRRARQDAAVVFLFIWVRATLPRLRYDQLMSFGWKILLPLATLNTLVTAVRGGDLMARIQDDDVIEVMRAPEPGVARGTYRAFGETLRGLKTTLAGSPRSPLTIQYPEEKTPVYPRFRGRHRLHQFEDTGLEKCVGCSLCAAACPADCIRVVAAENTRRTAPAPASATRPSTRSTCRAASSAATARSPARSTRSRWAMTTSSPTSTAAT